MKKLLLIGLLGCGCNFVAGAAPINCLTLNTMAALQAGLGVCATQNVLFSAFTYNEGDTGISADHVTATLYSAAFAGTIQVGWLFAPDGGNAWATVPGQTPMSIGYSVRLCTLADVGVDCFAAATPLQSFTMAKATEFAAFNNPASPNPALTNDFFGNNSGVLHLPTDNLTNANNTNSGTFSAGNTMVSPVVSTSSNGGALFSVQDLIIETTIPEPGTMVLFGSGLMFVALNLKKITRKLK